MRNKPTLIYQDAYGNTYMVQNLLAESTEEFFEMARSLALAAGFHPTTIDEIFNETEVEDKCIGCNQNPVSYGDCSNLENFFPSCNCCGECRERCQKHE